jgi:hypothetical protein
MAVLENQGKLSGLRVRSHEDGICAVLQHVGSSNVEMEVEVEAERERHWSFGQVTSLPAGLELPLFRFGSRHSVPCTE